MKRCLIRTVFGDVSVLPEMSGWMIFKDRYYIGGIGKLHDGDEILMKYSLNYDRDVKDILGE